MKKKSKFFLFGIVISVFIMLSFINWNNNKSLYKNIQLLMIDEHSNVIRDEIFIESDKNNITQNIFMSIDTNINSYYDVILLNNYNQIPFLLTI